MVALLRSLGLSFGGRRCRRRRDGWRQETRLERWVCARCGVEAFTSDGGPPKECKRALRPTAP